MSHSKGVYGDMMIKCNIVCWIGSWGEKEHFRLKLRKLNQAWTVVNNNVSILAH